MKQLFSIDDTIVNRISYYHLVCFLIALPFDFFYSELVLISFGIHTLIHIQKEKTKNIFTKPVLILSAVYLLGFAAILYSPDKPEAVNVATKQLAILIVPVLFALTSLNLEKYKWNLIVIFGFTCTLTILYLYADALYTILSLKLPPASLFSGSFMNHNFSKPIQIHATYLSLYSTFSLLAFLYVILKTKNLKQRWIYIIAAIILAAGMLQLSSRAVFIAFLLILNLIFPVFLFHGKKRLAFFVVATLLSAFTLTIIFTLDSFKERYISELRSDLEANSNIIEDAEPRLTRWNAIMELIKKSPVTGYGSGSEKELLKDKFFEKKLFTSYLHEFNAHNEYLSFLIKTGLIGLALFIYVLYFGFAAALQKQDILFLIFMTLIAIVAISENFLDVNKGIFFYSFFFSLFLLGSTVQKEAAATFLTPKTGNLY
jgi:O-antigen ligase